MSNYIVVNGIRIASDFEPETFGRLTTIGPRFRLRDTKGKINWYQVCQCDCGTCKVINAVNLKTGNTASCGCLQRESISNRTAKHRDYGSPEYRAYRHAKNRCYNKRDKKYMIYGGRGIKVCDRWLEPDGRGYMNFLEDMGRRPSTKHSVDRIDVNGDYSPENCRWATFSEQARNKRNTKYITAFGQTRPLAELVEQYFLSYSIVFYRIQDGWSPEDALTKPLGSRRDKKNP